MPSAASSTVGSGWILSKISEHSHRDSSTIRFAVPFFTKKGSATRNSRFFLREERAETAPAPARIFVLQKNSSNVYHRLFRR